MGGDYAPADQIELVYVSNALFKFDTIPLQTWYPIVFAVVMWHRASLNQFHYINNSSAFEVATAGPCIQRGLIFVPFIRIHMVEFWNIVCAYCRLTSKRI